MSETLHAAAAVAQRPPATRERGALDGSASEHVGIVEMPTQPERSGEGPRGMFRLDGPIVITIDGPAGTGKSTVAHRLARRLGIDILDTGAMYRCATAVALDHGIALEHRQRLIEVVRASHIQFDWKAQPPDILAFGKSYARRIREQDVTERVSYYAGVQELRELMVGMQRRIADLHPRLVTEGRDQGSVVFPKAKVKFYLDASPQVRAQRRADQLRREQGIEADLQQLREAIERRDANDAARPFGALKCPTDATRVDTSHLSLDEVVERLFELVVAKSKEPAPV